MTISGNGINQCSTVNPHHPTSGTPIILQGPKETNRTTRSWESSQSLPGNGRQNTTPFQTGPSQHLHTNSIHANSSQSGIIRKRMKQQQEAEGMWAQPQSPVRSFRLSRRCFLPGGRSNGCNTGDPGNQIRSITNNAIIPLCRPKWT